jgi:hypothetical protein
LVAAISTDPPHLPDDNLSCAIAGIASIAHVPQLADIADISDHDISVSVAYHDNFTDIAGVAHISHATVARITDIASVSLESCHSTIICVVIAEARCASMLWLYYAGV